MSTNSTIAVQLEDGTVRQIYAHWDGYLDGNGQLLQTHYNTLALAEELISHGNISSLGSSIGERHPFDPGYNIDNAEKQAKVKAAYDAARAAGWTTFYKRDRGDDGCAPSTFANLTEYVNEGDQQEYDYLFVNGQWHVRYYATSATDTGFVTLVRAFELAAEENE